eukprot:4870828-Pyramimonas_sp.AAC.1
MATNNNWYNNPTTSNPPVLVAGQVSTGRHHVLTIAIKCFCDRDLRHCQHYKQRHPKGHATRKRILNDVHWESLLGSPILQALEMSCARVSLKHWRDIPTCRGAWRDSIHRCRAHGSD